MLGQTIVLDEIERMDRESIGFTNLIEDRYISYSDCNIEYLNSDEIMNHQLYTISNTLGVIAFVNSENCIKISSTFEIHEYIQKRHEVPKAMYEYKLDSTPTFIKFSENGMNLVVSVKDEIIILNFTKQLKFKTLRHRFDSEIIEFDCKLDDRIFILLDSNSVYCLNYEHDIVVKKLQCVTDCSSICSNNKMMNKFLLVGTKTSDIILVNFEKDLVLFKCKISDVERVHCLNWFDNFYCTFSTFIPYNDAFDFKIIILQLNHECFLGHSSSDKELVIQGGSCMEFFPDFSKPVTKDNTCRYHTVYLDHWRILLCSTSTDSRVVVFQQNGDKFNLLTLNNKCSIETFPLYNDNPTFSLGLIADFGYDYQIDNIKSKTDAAKHEASPLIHIYLTSGFIATYSLTNCDELEKYPLVHASKSLSSLTIEEIKEEKKVEPKVESTPIAQDPPVKEEKPIVVEKSQEVKKFPESIKPIVEQPKPVFNPISGTGNAGGFNFGNTNSSTFKPTSNFMPTFPTLQTQPSTNTITQPTTTFTQIQPVSTTTRPTTTFTPFVNQSTSQKVNTVIQQPILPVNNIQKQLLAQPKSIDRIGTGATTGIIDKNMIKSNNNFSSNLATANTDNGFKKDFKPIISKPLKHEPINQIPLIPNSKPSQTPSKPSTSVGNFKNDLAVIQSKSSKSKSDEKVQQLSKETAKKVQDARIKFSLLKNAIENINNNQENEFKFTKSDILTIKTNIDRLSEVVVKTDESLKQRVERLNEYLNRECSIVELLDIKIKENRKESLKESGLDETAQYFKDVICHRFNNIITNIENLENQVKRKLNLSPQKLPTLICLQNTLSLQRNRAVEYRKYVLSVVKKLESVEHISKTDQFIQQLSMINSRSQPNTNHGLRKIVMTKISPILNNSSILKKKINLIHEEDSTLFKEYEDIDEISEISYEDEESKNPLNESFIQSESSSLDLLDGEDEDDVEDEDDEEDADTDTNSPINRTSTRDFSQPISFAQPSQSSQPVQPKPIVAGGFSFGEQSRGAPLSSNSQQFAFGSTTESKKEPASFSMGTKTERSEPTSSAGFSFGSSTTGKTDNPSTTKLEEKKDTIAFGTTPGFNFDHKESVTPSTTGFTFNTSKKETKPSTGLSTSAKTEEPKKELSNFSLPEKKEETKPATGLSFGTKTETTPSITNPAGSTGFNFGTDTKKEAATSGFETKTETTGSSGFNFGTLSSSKTNSKKEDLTSVSESTSTQNEEKSVDSQSTSTNFETKPLSNSFSTTPLSFEPKKEEGKIENKAEEPKKELSNFSLPEKKEETKPATGFSFATKTETTPPIANSTVTKTEPASVSFSTTGSLSGFNFGSSTIKTEPKKEETIAKEENKKEEVTEIPKNEEKKEPAAAFDFGKKEDGNLSEIFPTKNIETNPKSSEKSSFFESPPNVTDSKVLLSGFANNIPTKETLSFNVSKDISETKQTVDETKKEEPKEDEPKKDEPKREETKIEEPKKEEKKEEAKSTSSSGFSFGSTLNSGFGFANTNPQSESKPAEVSTTPKVEETKPAETKPSNVFETNPFNTVTKPTEITPFNASPITSSTTSTGLPSTNTVSQTSTTNDENGMEDNDDILVGGNSLGSLSFGTSNNSTNNNSTVSGGFTSFNSGSSNISSAFPSGNSITTFGSGNSGGSSFFEPVNNSVGDSPFSNPNSNSSLPFSFQGNTSFGSTGSFSFDSGRNPTPSSGFGSGGFGGTTTNTNSVLTSGFGSSALNTDTSKTFGTSFGSSGFASKSNTQPLPTSGGFGSGGFGSGSFGSNSASSNTQPASSGGFGSGGFGSGGFGSSTASGSSSGGFGSFSSTSGSSPFSSLSTGGTPSFLQGANNNLPSSSSFGNNNVNNGFGSFGSFGSFGTN